MTDGPRRAWMEKLDETVRYLAQHWSLDVGEPFQPGGQTAWVAAVRNQVGGGLVLKVGWRHSEAIHEADALDVWDGQGAVRLHAVEEFDDTIALLIEQCVPGNALASLPEPEQDIVIGGLLRRLWRDHRFAHGSGSLFEMLLRKAPAGRRRSRYVVQFGAVAVLDARLAGSDRRSESVLSHDAPRHRL